MKKFTEEDFTQALDYSLVLLQAYSRTMEICRVLDNPKVAHQYDKTLNEMAKLYQVIGSEAGKHDKVTKRNNK